MNRWIFIVIGAALFMGCPSKKPTEPKSLEIQCSDCSFNNNIVTLPSLEWQPLGRNLQTILESAESKGIYSVSYVARSDTLFLIWHDPAQTQYYLAASSHEWVLYMPTTEIDYSTIEGQFLWQGHTFLKSNQDLRVWKDSIWLSLGVGCDQGIWKWSGEWEVYPDTRGLASYCDGSDSVAILNLASWQWHKQLWIMPRAEVKHLGYLKGGWLWADSTHAYLSAGIGEPWVALNHEKNVHLQAASLVPLSDGVFLDVSHYTDEDRNWFGSVLRTPSATSYHIKTQLTPSVGCSVRYWGRSGDRLAFRCIESYYNESYYISVKELLSAIQAP